MGKSRLSVKSQAYRRQVEFYKTDQSRLGKNEVTYLDPLDEEDDVSLMDTQYENIRSCLEQLTNGTTVKVRDNTLIRGRKGVGKFSYIKKRNNSSLELEDTTDVVQGQKVSHQKKGNSSYASRVQAHRGAAKCTNTSNKERTILASMVNDRCSPQEMEQKAFRFFKLLVDGLDSKRNLIRHKSLQLLISILERSVIPEFLETMCITIFYGCLKSFMMGSAYESYLASHVIGLLAITIGNVSNSHEMMQESIPIFTLAWNLNSEPVALSALDCLAITTFFGADGVEEVEKSMSIIWEIFSLNPLSDSEKPTVVILAKAISAWSFLLTTIDPWRISLQIWKESFSFFFTLLEYDDYGISIAVGEAIAVIFETGRLDKFTRKDDADIVKINRKINELVNKTEAPRNDLDNMRETLETISKFLEVGETLETISKFLETKCHNESINIPNIREPLELSTVSQSIQLKYFKSFLGGDGFIKHIQHNEVLHDIFDFEAGKRETAFFNENVQSMIPTLEAHKGRTQSRSKHRMHAKDMEYGFGHFDITCQD